MQVVGARARERERERWCYVLKRDGEKGKVVDGFVRLFRLYVPVRQLLSDSSLELCHVDFHEPFSFVLFVGSCSFFRPLCEVGRTQLIRFSF